MANGAEPDPMSVCQTELLMYALFAAEIIRYKRQHGVPQGSFVVLIVTHFTACFAFP